MESRKEDLEKLQEWLRKQSHLPQKIDEVLLYRFLHTCNYSLEQAKHLIDIFYTIRWQAPEIFGNRDPTDEGTEQIFRIVDMVPLPKVTKDNYKLLVYRFCDSDPDKYNFVDSLRTFFMMADTRLISEKSFTDGEVPIFDMEGWTLRHLTKVTLPVLKKYMLYTQEAHPIRLKQIHILNIPSYLDKCLALLRPFMKSEVAQMLHFHLPNSETLYEYIPKELLPEEYGGQAGRLSDMKKDWIKKVKENKDYFADQSRWKVDECRRPVQNNNGKLHFGIQGSFRSLSID